VSFKSSNLEIMTKSNSIAIIGGGAAGVFAAIAAAEASPSAKIYVFEKSNKLLSKVLISGGGRCNVTHACFDPNELIDYYPRGSKELLGPFNRFGCGDTMEWFEDRGVELKIEDDNRVFPVSDKSSTIVDCLLDFAKRSGVDFQLRHGVKSIKKDRGEFFLDFDSGKSKIVDKVLVASGGSKKLWDELKSLEHKIISPVPSLFTFNIRDLRLKDMAGITIPHVRITVPIGGFETEGPLLITHWGLSGPSVLKLSSFGARWMNEVGHCFSVFINWAPNMDYDDLFELLNGFRKDFDFQRKRIISNSMFNIPLRIWKALCLFAKVPSSANWSDLSKPSIRRFCDILSESEFQVTGKSTNKEEFVTSGGVALNEIDFRTFESKLVPGLYFAGEVMDIDALTGGFNFQSAWTSAWLAGHSIVNHSFGNP